MPIFHTVFDLDDRFQIPGAAHLYEGCKNCREGGRGAHWRGIYDDKGRIMVAISYNSDVGDAWEFADDPAVSGEVFRLGDSHRRKLRGLRHDALIAAARQLLASSSCRARISACASR